MLTKPYRGIESWGATCRVSPCCVLSIVTRGFYLVGKDYGSVKIFTVGIIRRRMFKHFSSSVLPPTFCFMKIIELIERIKLNNFALLLIETMNN